VAVGGLQKSKVFKKKFFLGFSGFSGFSGFLSFFIGF